MLVVPGQFQKEVGGGLLDPEFRRGGHEGGHHLFEDVPGTAEMAPEHGRKRLPLGGDVKFVFGAASGPVEPGGLGEPRLFEEPDDRPLQLSPTEDQLFPGGLAERVLHGEDDVLRQVHRLPQARSQKTADEPRLQFVGVEGDQIPSELPDHDGGVVPCRGKFHLHLPFKSFRCWRI